MSDEIIETLFNYTTSTPPKSFYLVAGAGSGKTHTLVKLLEKIEYEKSLELKREFKKVAIITYTNAACDEIKARIQSKDFADVSTVHSFAWNLINCHTKEIKCYLQTLIEEKIKETELKESNGRSGATKASVDRKAKIKHENERLNKLNTVKKFRYSPDQNLVGIDCLNHSEVISIASHFIEEYPLFKTIITQKYPILFIDECQDTEKGLMKAIFKLQKEKKDKFVVGLFGDHVQRIYNSGLVNLISELPADWEKPRLSTNYRSLPRIVELNNSIRSLLTKNEEQTSHKEGKNGLVRLFIVGEDNDKEKIEKDIAIKMDKIIYDGKNSWQNKDDVKILILEHHMAAKRYGFQKFYDPFNNTKISSKIRDGLRDARLEGLDIFIDIIIPLIDSKNNKYKQANIVKKHLVLLNKTGFNKDDLVKAKSIIDDFYTLVKPEITLRVLLKNLYNSKLFKIPDVFKTLFSNENLTKYIETDIDIDIDNYDTDLSNAWNEALECTVNELRHYLDYVDGSSTFATHQGVKGLEFNHVMAIISDDEARGFTHNYEKIVENESIQKLFYVVCSRAKESLAVVWYTKNDNKVKDIIEFFKEKEIFKDNEIEKR